jgi:hypothetical protein
LIGLTQKLAWEQLGLNRLIIDARELISKKGILEAEAS